jgi:hypothetical protein
MPGAVSSKQEAPRGVLSIIDQIGNYFYDAVVIQTFNSDPPGTFVVDSRVDDRLLESLGKALNAGAIVYVPDDDSHLVMSSLRGKRFRLSYLLAPNYGIPIRLGPPVSLKTILGRSTNRDLHLFGYGAENE